jgi:hypothetical protein
VNKQERTTLDVRNIVREDIQRSDWIIVSRSHIYVNGEATTSTERTGIRQVVRHCERLYGRYRRDIGTKLGGGLYYRSDGAG